MSMFSTVVFVATVLDFTEQASIQLSGISLANGPASLDVSSDVRATCPAGNVTLCEVWALLRSMRQEIDALKLSVTMPSPPPPPTAPPAPPPPALPPADPDTFLLLHLDTDLVDSSQYNHAVSSFSDAGGSSAQHKFGAGSAYFDGINDKLQIAADAHTAVGDSDFTMEAWAYPLSGSNMQYGGVVGTSDHAQLLGNKIETNGNRWRWLVRNSNGGDFDAYAPSSMFSLDQWQHLACVRHNGRFKFYVNGALAQEGPAFNLSPTDTLPIVIGQRILPGYSGVYFKGYIDEVRLSNVARYTAPFTPASAAFESR